jgi:sugar/nucleoside kinase (ribokinase family)
MEPPRANTQPLALVGFTLIIDDIVLPTGTTFMQQIGGGGAWRVCELQGTLTRATADARLRAHLPLTRCAHAAPPAGPQTLFGFQLVHTCLAGAPAQLGLAAGVGGELPAACRTWLAQLGVDVSGLIEGQLPTPRAWQLFETDGTRTQVGVPDMPLCQRCRLERMVQVLTNVRARVRHCRTADAHHRDPLPTDHQVWRVPECDALYRQLRPKFEQLPTRLQAARHYHLGIHAAHPPMTLLRHLRAAARARGGEGATQRCAGSLPIILAQGAMPQHPPCPPPPPPHTHTHARTFTAGLLSVETYTACDAPPPEGETRELLAAVDVFSPNVAEAASVVGPGEPPQLLARLMALGAHTVLLRMAEAGVLIGRRRRRRRRSSSSSSSSSSGGGSSGSGGGSSGGGSEGAGGGDGGYDQWHVSGADRGACKGDAAGLRNSHRAPDTTHTHTHTHTHTRARARARAHKQVPAVPGTHVVDVIGCGNACCGGFLAALDAGLAVADAGAWGCVAGSIMAEAQGAPAPDALPRLVPAAQAKLSALRTASGGSHEGGSSGSAVSTPTRVVHAQGGGRARQRPPSLARPLAGVATRHAPPRFCQRLGASRV